MANGDKLHGRLDHYFDRLCMQIKVINEERAVLDV